MARGASAHCNAILPSSFAGIRAKPGTEMKCPPLQAYTEIEGKASQWNARGCPTSGPSLLTGHEVKDWKGWIDNSVRYGHEPQPTELQKRFIHASEKHAIRNLLRNQFILSAMLLLILIGACCSVFYAVQSNEKALQARQAAFQAEEAEQRALFAQQQAWMGQKEAIRQKQIAEREKQAVLVWNLLRVAEQDTTEGFFSLKLLLQALRMLARVGRPDLDSRALDLFRKLLAYKDDIIPCTGLLQGMHLSTPYLAFHPAGDGRVASFSWYVAQNVRLWDAMIPGSNNPVQILPNAHSVPVSATAFGPEGSGLLVNGVQDGSLDVWRERPSGEWENVAVMRNHTKAIWQINISPSGTLIASCESYSADPAIRIWQDWDNGSPKVTLLHGHKSWVFAMAWRPQGLALASSSDDKSVWLWELSPHGDLVASRSLFEGDSVTGSLAWHPDGMSLAAARRDKRTVIFDLETGTQQVVAPPDRVKPFPGYIHWYGVSPSAPLGGGLISAIATVQNDVIVRSIPASGPRSVERSLHRHENTDKMTHLVLSLDGQWAATADKARLMPACCAGAILSPCCG